ncbi:MULTISPECIES: DUF2000 domain-containing protein [Bacillus]|uniref:DUF2000 domain-containing protein n=1 Tax=Bacillus paralicheniformis TaxID=1648923 RepID=A0A7Z1B3X9_9BACI|nr:DUF2000 domain-containing protein [Bacillus paralicheniformis]KND07373.1 hypothetical protein ACJ43_12925 [Bacillus paralicheniformis]MBL7477240.1 DUF2000 domain-containing protein [Bacillus paralicheniformis]MCW4364710.1 DUF2000 domain-containing protein [Bacillus paralicheniformis]MED1129023.1 DUF2000 domain-containing protein [Bacillus paralicheniformis]OLF93816.1 hypothetical protein B4121_2186 [Bacillus paralicheniformis]
MIEETKCALIIDESLPLGLIANTAAILGAALGKNNPGLLGEHVMDGSGIDHLGIVKLPIPILKGNAELLHQLRQKLLTDEFNDILTVDFTDVAQGIHTYEAYIETFQSTAASDYSYFGIGVCGDKKKVARLTGSLGLLR